MLLHFPNCLSSGASLRAFSLPFRSSHVPSSQHPSGPFSTLAPPPSLFAVGREWALVRSSPACAAVGAGVGSWSWDPRDSLPFAFSSLPFPDKCLPRTNPQWCQRQPHKLARRASVSLGWCPPVDAVPWPEVVAVTEHGFETGTGAGN